MEHTSFHTIRNMRTHMVVETDSGRCLGGVGSNFYRPWVFPLYTPLGYTVLREFAFDHPFHNGVFVGQHPVILGHREANFWVTPPRRSFDDPVYTKVGRMDVSVTPEIELHGRGGRFTFTIIWRDENEEPMVEEIRTVNLYALADATACEMTSQKIASYGSIKYPKTKYGSIGIRVEPRLLPGFGGAIIGDEGRRGTSNVVHEQESDFVAYENRLPGGDSFGVCMSISFPQTRGPWFIRDYGMALYNPTWKESVHTPKRESWTISLRVVAYDGPLTEERVQRWVKE